MAKAIFQNCRIYIVPNGLLKKRLQLFKEQVTKYGGVIISDVTSTEVPTHVVVEDNNLTNLNQVESILQTNELDYENWKCDLVSTLWLSRCIKEKKLLDTENFKLKYKRDAKREDPIVGDEPPTKIQRNQVIPTGPSCDKFSRQELSMNEKVIEELQKLADAYRACGDRWRTLAYDKAIGSLRSYRKPFSNTNDLKLLPHVSVKMLDKIVEIMENGSCSKVEEICGDEKTKILNLFKKVWGVGDVTAQALYQKGYRTLDDLRNKANLTWQQEIGLKYFEEIQERIPRCEMQEIADYVRKAVEEVDSTLQVMVCGSFRRGKAMSKDIDMLVVAKISKHILHEILPKLRSRDFLVADLSVGKDHYLGLCKLPENDSKIRRLDLFVVSGNQVGCALVHYTGSRLFNIGIRRHAIKMKMKLTEEHLIFNGQILPTPTEESVFEQLKLPYRRPEERETF